MWRTCCAVRSRSGRAAGRIMRGSARSHLVCNSTVSSVASPSEVLEGLRKVPGHPELCVARRS
eukprot:9206878-Alexandrium_andersonii.AAC.1